MRITDSVLITTLRAQGASPRSFTNRLADIFPSSRNCCHFLGSLRTWIPRTDPWSDCMHTLSWVLYTDRAPVAKGTVVPLQLTLRTPRHSTERPRTNRQFSPSFLRSVVEFTSRNAIPCCHFVRKLRRVRLLSMLYIDRARSGRGHSWRWMYDRTA